MNIKLALASVTPVRQRTQYSCMSASMLMALKANGYPCSGGEDEVNRVMGAAPMKGAAWEQALACAQHYGCRATLTVPSTIPQLKSWTDRGIPVMIAWNPEGREWSHASLAYDVTEGAPSPVPDYATVYGSGPGLYVWVADPNIPHPERTVRIVHEDHFYEKWYEKWPNYMVRRPAMAIEREITVDGRQVMASSNSGDRPSVDRVLASFKEAKDITLKLQPEYGRSEYGPEFVTQIMRHPGNGAHQTRTKDVAQGRSRKEKHKKNFRDMEASISRVASIAIMAERVAARHLLMKNAGPLSDVSKLRYQAVFMMGAAGSGKSYVAYKWLKYMPGMGSGGASRKEVERLEGDPSAAGIAHEERLLKDLDFTNAVKFLKARGFEVELSAEGSAKIPFQLYLYNEKGSEQHIPPDRWKDLLPPDVYRRVEGMKELVFATPKRELPSYWRSVAPDVFKEEIPGFSKESPGYVHEMSSLMGRAYFDAAIETGGPLFIDGTGTNLAKMAQQISDAKAYGYRTSLVFVRVPLTINQIRNATRSRNLDPDVVASGWKIIDQNYDKLKGLADKARRIDNRNDPHDKSVYEAQTDKIENFILRETSYGSLRELISVHSPEELSVYDWLR